MQKKLFIFLNICLIVWFFSAPIAASAATADELKAQIDANSAMLAQKSQEARTLQNQVAIFDGRITDAQLKVQQTQYSINTNQSEISKLQDQIKQKETELQVQKDNLNETARVVYEAGTTTTLEVMVSSNSLSDIVDKSQYLESISSKINESVDTINKIKADMQANIDAQQQKKQESESLLGQQQDFKDSLAGQKAAKDELLSVTKGQESEYQKRVAELQAQLAAIYSRGGKGSPVGTQLVSNLDGGWYYNQNNYPNDYLGGSGLSVKQAGCLISSIAMIASKYGHRISPSGLVDASYFSSEGGWAGFSRNVGVSVGRSQRVNWDVVNSELSQGRPVIASVYVGGPRYNSDGSNHFIVLKSISNGKYLIQDPYWTNSSYDESDVISIKIVKPL